MWWCCVRLFFALGKYRYSTNTKFASFSRPKNARYGLVVGPTFWSVSFEYTPALLAHFNPEKKVGRNIILIACGGHPQLLARDFGNSLLSFNPDINSGWVGACIACTWFDFFLDGNTPPPFSFYIHSIRPPNPSTEILVRRVLTCSFLVCPSLRHWQRSCRIESGPGC